eukprot:tig00020780_g13759.t1
MAFVTTPTPSLRASGSVAGLSSARSAAEPSKPQHPRAAADRAYAAAGAGHQFRGGETFLVRRSFYGVQLKKATYFGRFGSNADIPAVRASAQPDEACDEDVPTSNGIMKADSTPAKSSLADKLSALLAKLKSYFSDASEETPVLANAGAAGSVPQPAAPKTAWKKLIPMLIMFFAILFNYTILRDTKDVLVVTAPGSGAEAIPFLKTWVVVPAALGFLVFYTKMSNVLSRENLFYSALVPFLLFFGLFATVLYPAKDLLHPTASADWLASILPAGFSGPIAIYRNWTYALFYVLAELWGSVVLSLLFWGFANEICKVEEAKKFYPLFGLGANVALVVSGRVVKYLSNVRDSLPAGVDPWGYSLNALMGLVLLGGLIVLGTYWAMNRWVLTDPEMYTPPAAGAPVKSGKKKKPKMSVKESFMYLGQSPYIRNLAVLVISYGVSINLVEVTWKSKIKQAFPNPNQYSSFMGDFSTLTGICTLGMMLLSRVVFKKFGWGTAAMVTPGVLLATGLSFFGLILFEDFFTPVTQMFGISPLMLAVFCGAAQNILSKATKYSLFDPTKEMAYIPLDPETKVKGKAAIDVVGARLGKSGGAFLQQVLIVSLGSLSASTPVLAACFLVVILMWVRSTSQLSKDFKVKSAEFEKEQKKIAEAAAASAPAIAPRAPSPKRQATVVCPQCLGSGVVYRKDPAAGFVETPCKFCEGSGSVPEPVAPTQPGVAIN